VQEPLIRNMTDDELIQYALDTHGGDIVIVELALRLEAQHDATAADDGSDP
jgi:hypothetical protein